ncbi:MAG: tetratricopeptide repeat protein, partial [Planctomycetota bacterium]
TAPGALKLFETGRTQADRFHHAEAAASFQAATALDPEFAMAWLQYAFVAGSTEGVEKGMTKAKAAREKVTEAERLMIDAADAEHRGRMKEAQRIRHELARQFPQDARTRYLLGMSYWMTENETGVGHMEKAVQLDPELDVAWNMLGYAYSSLGRHAEAVKAHRRYVELLYEEQNAHDSLAETLMKAGSFEKSIAEYEKALELDPTFVWSRMGIGHNLVFLERQVEAGQAYERALTEATSARDKHQAADWLVVLGVYSGDPLQALAAADRAVELARDLGEVEVAWAIRNRARIELLAGKPKEAEATARRAVEALPEGASASARDDLVQAVLRLQVEARIAMKDLEGARSVLEQVRQMTEASKNSWQIQLYHFTEGFLRLAEGNASAASAALAKASQTDPRVLFHLGEARAAQKKQVTANRLFRRVEKWNAPSLSHALVLAGAKKRLAE